jgi:hypothetical protein
MEASLRAFFTNRSPAGTVSSGVWFLWAQPVMANKLIKLKERQKTKILEK